MGFDKAFLKHDGQSLLLGNAQQLSRMFERVVLVSNDQTKLTEIAGLERYEVLVDQLPGCGPLGGIVTALTSCDTPYIFAMACDMPHPRLDLIEKMSRGKDGYQVAICVHENRIEPLFAFYHHSCLEIFEKQLREGHLQVRQNFAQLKTHALCLSTQEVEDAFVNINTPQDYERWMTETQNGGSPC